MNKTKIPSCIFNYLANLGVAQPTSSSIDCLKTLHEETSAQMFDIYILKQFCDH